MELRDHARHLLHFSRRFSEGLLGCFKTPEDWVFQIHPKANHALWITGHLALVDNAFIAKFRPALAAKPEGWDALFGFGSQPKPDASVYPSPERVHAYFRDRREALVRVLDELSEEELRAPAPAAGERSPIAGAPSLGHAFIFIAYHEGMHSGQLSVAHRALGHAPLIG
jgi:uncharacterized damage-inducible protein DinB